MLAARITAWLLALSLALFPAMASAQSSPINAFPPGVFGNQAPLAPAVVPMKTPVLGLSAPSGTISTTASTWNSLIVGTPQSTWSAANSNREEPIAIAGKFSNLVVNFPVAVGAGTSYSVALTQNGANTALLCQVISAALTCTDTTDTVTIAPGDTVGWVVCPGPITAGSCVPGTAPNAQGVVQISGLFTSTNTNESFIVAATVGNLTPPSNMGFGVSGAVSGTEANVSSVIPTAGILDQLYVAIQTSPGAAASISYTIFQNGTGTGVTCTIGPSASAKTCSDLTHSITVAAGDTISLGSAVVSGSPSGPSSVRAGLRWRPTTSGEALLLAVSSVNFPDASTRQTTVSGGASDVGESSAFTTIPIASTVKKLFVAVSTVPGGTTTRTITVRKGTGAGQSNTSVACTIASAATTCSDASDTYSASLNDFTNLQETASGSPASLTYFKTGLVITVP